MITPRDDVQVTGRALSFGAGPGSNGAEGPASDQPYDAPCGAPRGFIIPASIRASLDVLNAAALTLAERVTLASETIGLALAVSVCWPPGLDPS